MGSTIVMVVYLNGNIIEGDEGIMFEGCRKILQIQRNISLKRLKSLIHTRLKLRPNEVIGSITSRYCIDNKYAALSIVDTSDVELMINNFESEDMGHIEICVEVSIAGGSSNVSGSYDIVSHYQTEFTRLNSSDDDDEDYEMSHSYAESSSEGEDLEGNLLESDDGESNIGDCSLSLSVSVQPISFAQTGTGVSEETFWQNTPHYTNINWDHPDQEELCGVSLPTSWELGQELCVGLEFDNKKGVQDALKHYVMNIHHTVKVMESKSNKYIVRCGNRNPNLSCPFYLRAIESKRSNRWKVTQWGGPHTCLNASLTQDHVNLDSDLICSSILGMVREDPSIKISLVQERVASVFNYKISYRRAWLGKQKAMTMIYGDWAESYAELPVWLHYMQLHSPGSHYQIWDEDFVVGNRTSHEFRQFHRVFWCYKQCANAFNFCKPIIQVDGTHLYGRYRGTLLIATTQDGNGSVLPLAFAVVEGETQLAWSWFLSKLRLHVTEKSGICLISDRHQSIKAAVNNEAIGWSPPQAYHVYCIRHIASNFNHKFKNHEQKKMLVKLGYTPCKHIFDRNLEKFCELSPAIATWIQRISKEKWSMAYDSEGHRYGHMTTNLSECVNKVFKGVRNLPITALVKATYSRCREYFVERGQRAQQEFLDGSVYCSKVMVAIRNNQNEATSHIVRVYDIQQTRFEVEETFNPLTQRGGKKWTVILNDKYCQCGRFTAFHYPCSHIIAVCGYVSLDFNQFIDKVYKNEYIMKAYSSEWWPLGNEDAFPPVQQNWKLIPDPATIRGKGRPKSTRIRNEMDWVEPSQNRPKCRLCGEEGHNRRLCPLNTQPQQ